MKVFSKLGILAAVLPLAGGCISIGGSDGSGNGGKADDGSDGGNIAAWDAHPTRLSADHAVGLLVAPDESRVAYSQTAADFTAWGCWGRAGIGDLRMVSVNAPDQAITVSSLAGFRESAFTSDSSWLVYTRYTAGTNPCSDLVGLVGMPAAGGTTSSLNLGITYYYKQLSVAGTSVVFSAFGGGANDKGTLRAAGLGGHYSAGTLGYGAGAAVASQDPSGRALVYDDPNGHLHLRSLVATTDVDLSTTYPATGAPAWSPDGALLAISWVQGETRSVTIMGRDGSNPRTVLAGCDRDATFSPDGAWIGCLGGFGTGAGRITVAKVSDGTSSVIDGLPDPSPGNGWWYYTPDSQFIHYVDDKGATWGTYALYAAPTSGGSFQQITDAMELLGETATVDQQHYVAYVGMDNDYNHYLEVVSPGGTQTDAIPTGVAVAQYEQTANAPRLAVLDNYDDSHSTGRLELLTTDGAGPVIHLPGRVARFPAPFWNGRMLFYAVNKHTTNGEDSFDLIATSDDGSKVGVVLSGVARVVNGKHLFIARSAEAGGGVYTFDVPAL